MTETFFFLSELFSGLAFCSPASRQTCDQSIERDPRKNEIQFRVSYVTHYTQYNVCFFSSGDSVRANNNNDILQRSRREDLQQI